jgi:hypothetical protein
MLLPILEHVNERVPYLTRSFEQVRVIAVTPDRSSTAQHPIDCLRDADREPLNTARKPRRLVRLHQQVQMIGLNAEVKEPEAIA